MKIKNLKINGFGKLENKEIELENSINLIYGKNEAGKSTILKFITSMLYGLTKNKNGGSIPEIEKYEPWKAEEFSGKITYELDNGEKYEVYRDFKKKNPKIFNKNLEDISKNFTIDKTKGNQFFYDQVGIEEEIFTSSIITKQAEVKLDEKAQNILIQKISNILGTGDDNTSYETIVNKLKKKLNDEVGTANTKERPINIVENRIEELLNQKKELESYQESKFNIEETIKQKRENIEKEQKELEELRIANLKKEKLKEDESRIKIGQEMINTIKQEIETAKSENEHYKIEKKKRIGKKQIIILPFLIILIILNFIFIKNRIVNVIGMAIIMLGYFIDVMFCLKKQQKAEKKVQSKKKEIEEKIKILEQNKQQQINSLDETKKNYEEKLIAIQKENHIENLDNLLNKIDEKQRQINEDTLNLHTLEIDNNTILPKLEKLVNIEEELEDLQEEKRDLEEKRENIKRTLEYLEIAYYKMKEQITPKFTEELSLTMEKISGGKYKRVSINTSGEMIVEENTGEYINAENLSIGTLDQLYLSLRLATIKEMTKENMPIILDEAFAYYDAERLKNILEYLSNEYADKQVIIFTCTNREEEILNSLKFKYNKIEL